MIELNTKIEALIAKDASCFEISQLFKSSINSYLDSTDSILDTSSGKDFSIKHTKKIDLFLTLLYKYLLKKQFGFYLPSQNYIPITVVALGSYGREQLCIYSDIDLMIIYEDIASYNLKPFIEEFITLAWDCGLKLGSRVHELYSIEACVKKEQTIKTSLLESRMICGSKHLWALYETILNRIRQTNKQKFILQKVKEHKQRLLKYPLTMQPDIKKGYGGIREANMLFWIANTLYGVNDTKKLIGRCYLQKEYTKFRLSLEFIFQVRNVLHCVAKRRVDQINFDILPKLSSKLGFSHRPKATKERQFMQKLFGCLHNIHFFTSIMIKKFTRRATATNLNIYQLKSFRVSANIYIINNKLYTSFCKKPNTLLTVLKEVLLLPSHIKSFDSSYIYYISRTILPKRLRKEHNEVVKSILFKSELYVAIELFYSANLLQTIISSVKKIINLPQFDGYHQHPVDIHSINSLKLIENIEEPYILNIYNNLSKKEQSLAKIAALFHDIGKGRETDHHIIGEKLFKNIAKTLGFQAEDTAVVSKIIRDHNLMSSVATKEDIYSQRVILSFTANIKTKVALDILYIVSYADISAVGTQVYSSSIALLLKELYLQSLQAFDNAELLNESARRVAKINSIKKLSKFKGLSNMMKKRISYIASNQIFLQLKAHDILELAIKAKDVETYSYKIINKELLTIRIIRAIPLNLGYLLGKLEFLNIASMNIFKLFDNKKCFEISFSEKVEQSNLRFIEEVIKNSFHMSSVTKLHFPVVAKKEVQIDCNHTQYLASMKVKTKDQKGLLAHIAKIFDDFNIEIESAKIHTSRGKARDLFLIEKNGNFCANTNEIIDLICAHSLPSPM